MLLSAVIRKSHSCSRLYYATKNDESHLVLRSNIKFKTTEVIFFKAIELHHSFVANFYCPNSDIKAEEGAASSLKASSALGYLCSLYNILHRLVSWIPKLISLTIIKVLVLSMTKRQNVILNFVHFSLLAYAFNVIHADKNKSK